jgi:hypothetical protein
MRGGLRTTEEKILNYENKLKIKYAVVIRVFYLLQLI